MPANDPVLVDQIVAQRRASLAREQSDSDVFELFVAEEVLKDHYLSYEELASGLVGGGNDGGIDGFWVFVNGDLVYEDANYSGLKSNVDVELVIVQAKNSSGFAEAPIDRLIAATENLLDLSNSLAQYAGRYRPELLSAVSIFRETYQSLAGRFPSLKIRYVYATKGMEVHPNTQLKANDLRAKIPSLFSDAESSVEFIGAAELLSLARRQPKRCFALDLAESPICTSGAVAYICLVGLRDYAKFITSDSGGIEAGLFESNVRDYQGSTEVNKEIQGSLRSGGPEDFWWLNNGITVIARQATQSGKKLTIEDPQVVNGLQTSQQIFDYFTGNPSAVVDSRLVLVRVIVPGADESRDKIIKATNSQTYIPPASLKATDKIQRDIEEFLRVHGLYYDRRKNFYKNEGRPVTDIVGIPTMAQALMAIILARPDTARARPSSLIKSESDYESLFSTEHPIEVYLTCIRILREAESYLRAHTSLEPKDRNNMRFYVALELARDITGELVPSLSALKAAAKREIRREETAASAARVIENFHALGGTDQVAKGPELNAVLRNLWRDAI